MFSLDIVVIGINTAVWAGGTTPASISNCSFGSGLRAVLKNTMPSYNIEKAKVVPYLFQDLIRHSLTKSFSDCMIRFFITAITHSIQLRKSSELPVKLASMRKMTPSRPLNVPTGESSSSSTSIKSVGFQKLLHQITTQVKNIILTDKI